MPSCCVEQWPIPHWVMPIYHVEWACITLPCCKLNILTLSGLLTTKWSTYQHKCDVNYFWLIQVKYFWLTIEWYILARLIKLVLANQDVWQIVLNSLFIQLLVSLSKLNIIEQKLIKVSSSKNSAWFISTKAITPSNTESHYVIKVGQL